MEDMESIYQIYRMKRSCDAVMSSMLASCNARKLPVSMHMTRQASSFLRSSNMPRVLTFQMYSGLSFESVVVDQGREKGERGTTPHLRARSGEGNRCRFEKLSP